MNAKYTAAMRSVVGTRDEQQDHAFQSVAAERVVAAVCDGMGGLESGRIVSIATIEKFKELYAKKEPDEAIPSFLLTAVDILDEFIFQMKHENGESLHAGTTLVAAVIENDNLFWLSVGDSRLYILRGSEFVQATRDHNYFLRLDEMMREKEITENQYQAEAARGEALISFIGMGGIEVMDISNAPFKLLPKDTVLLSTDGLYKALSREEIAACLRMEDVEEALTALLDRASEKACQSQDNTTCVIIRYNEERANYETY